jgi:hypothetical protein
MANMAMMRVVFMVAVVATGDLDLDTNAGLFITATSDEQTRTVSQEFPKLLFCYNSTIPPHPLNF